MPGPDTAALTARRRSFVGREAQRELFVQAMAASEPRLLHLRATAGTGKSSLVAELVAMARGQGRRVAHIDFADVPPDAHAILDRLRAQLGPAFGRELGPGDAPGAGDAASGAPLLLSFDTLEAAGPAVKWLFAQLRGPVVVLMAGRDELPPETRTDLRWRDALTTVALPNLDEAGARRLLGDLGVDEAEHGEIFAFTGGHPLALTLVGESLRERGGSFARMPTGSVISALVERFTRDVQDAQRRQALEASMLVRVINEPLLRALVGVEDCYALFAWLRGLSFFEPTSGGLRPHDLVRKAVVEDLRWRDEERFELLRERARDHYEREAERARGDEVREVACIYDVSFLHAQNPLAREYFDWSSDQALLPTPMAQSDRAKALASVEAHQGPEAAKWLATWMDRSPEHCHVFRDQQLEPVGFHCAPEFDEASLRANSDDPCVAALHAGLEARGMLRGQERVILTRFWLSYAGYQSVGPVQSRMWLHMMRRYALSQSLAVGSVVFADPDFWEPIFGYMGYERVTGEGAAGSVFVHDFRVRPFDAWIRMLSKSSSSRLPTAPAAIKPRPLERQAFVAAVKSALREHDDASALQRSVLLGSRFVIAEAGEEGEQRGAAGRASALRRAIFAAAEQIGRRPDMYKQHRAVMAFYLRGAASQELAAESTGVPLSSFRRHLRKGVEEIAELLWRRETGEIANAARMGAIDSSAKSSS